MIAGIGYSRGEDKCIVADGVDLKGALIAGYLGDGDINICIKKAADTGVLVNSDPKVYNPNAVNFVGTGSFVEADDKFIASMKQGLKGSCEDRIHSETGKKVSVCVNGTATWTPGDSKVFFEAKKLGISIKVLASTKEYLWQMPTAVIGNDAWMKAHRAETKAFLAAVFEGGERVRSDRAALTIAGAEQAKVYGEQDAAYWVSMFDGVTEKGPNGKPIELGGSTTNGLADAARLFGLNGADNLYKQVYTVYGKIAVKYFPDIMPGGMLSYDDVVDSSYVQELVQATGNVGQAALPKYGATTETFAARAVSIEFEIGKATFTPAATKALNDILDNAAVSGLSVQINGHTDAKGNPQANIELSKARADAVKQFLMTNAPTSFPAERVTTRGFGSSMPVGTDAQNRRVEIILRK
jgi:outer membrane protein OmpA-like peptidoglycan-associated protein